MPDKHRHHTPHFVGKEIHADKILTLIWLFMLSRVSNTIDVRETEKCQDKGLVIGNCYVLCYQCARHASDGIETAGEFLPFFACHGSSLTVGLWTPKHITVW